MIIKYISSYPKLVDGKIKLDKNGIPITVFKYRVTGDPSELSQYDKIQSSKELKTIKDDKGYLWFSPLYVGETATLSISVNDKIYADTSLIDAAKSLIQQHGRLGEILAADLLKNGFSKSREDNHVSHEKEHDSVESKLDE